MRAVAVVVAFLAFAAPLSAETEHWTALRGAKRLTEALDPCLAEIIQRESGWNPQARNRRSGAYGLPQALPGSKMATAGADWRTNPVTQLRWAKRYVERRYGGSCEALEWHKQKGWY